jgi:Pyridoxamine 5'-phosphate oxidase
MKEAEHTYTAPTTTRRVPDGVADYLDGTGLLAKSQALRLATVDADGWPHAALLSAGDMVVTPSGRIRFALFPQSSMTSNLEREGRLTMSLSLDGGMYELRLRSHRLANPASDVPLALFEAEVEAVRHHVAPYARVTGGVTFVLNDPQAVLPRWQRQIAALRAA